MDEEALLCKTLHLECCVRHSDPPELFLIRVLGDVAHVGEKRLECSLYFGIIILPEVKGSK